MLHELVRSPRSPAGSQGMFARSPRSIGYVGCLQDADGIGEASPITRHDCLTVPPAGGFNPQGYLHVQCMERPHLACIRQKVRRVGHLGLQEHRLMTPAERNPGNSPRPACSEQHHDSLIGFRSDTSNLPGTQSAILQTLACRIPILETARTLGPSGRVEKLVDEGRKVICVLVQETMPRVWIQVQLSISMLQHVPHQYAVLCW